MNLFTGNRRGVVFMAVAGVALTAMSATIPAAVAKREIVAKQWDAMPLEDAKKVSSCGDPFGKPETVSFPKEDAELWGWWKFWNGQWWATSMFMQESSEVSWMRPKRGMDKPNDAYKGAWIKTQRQIPIDWRGDRVVFSLDGLKNCDVLLFINRKMVDIIRSPGGETDITKHIVFGGSNAFHLLIIGSRADFRLTKDPPWLISKPPICVEDVFANTSWRKKTLTVEAEIQVPKPCVGILHADVFDRDGKKVKSLGGKYELRVGTNILKPSVAWEDPITWELGRGYLYTLKTMLEVGGKKYGYKDVKFGFREIWREERKIFMNGHEQKYRATYNFGCNKYGAKFLTGLGYNCIQYAHRTEADPVLNEDVLEYLSENGIATIEPMTAFDWNTKNPLLSAGEKRDIFKRQQAKNLKRYRNWPCIAMYYMGVNTYLPQWAYEAVHLGSGDGGTFAKMMDDLVASAKDTNPNVLYFSHSDGNTGEIASANLYLNWTPLQERETWPSRWAERGHFPFQACEFGHPYQYSWYRDVPGDCISEYCAMYYGEPVYLAEPSTIQQRHIQSLYIRRMQHPYYWRLTDDFYWRTTRAWRTYGINAGIVWFNLDYGFGMPGWTIDKIYNKYGPAYNFFKSEDELPKGKPEWAFPSWDIYRRGNLDFLGWIAGTPQITDRRHAYYAGEKVEKRNVMMWDRFDDRVFSAIWTAELGGRRIASGTFRHTLKSNVPVFDDIVFTAPDVTARTAGIIKTIYSDASGAVVAKDECAFEVFPRRAVKWEKAPAFALYDPEGRTAAELKRMGVVNFKTINSLSALPTGTARLVIGAFALGKDDGWKVIPRTAVEKGLRVLVLPQAADAWKAFGFRVQDRQSRILFLRDHQNPLWRHVSDDCLREWSGAPRTTQEKNWDGRQYGSLVKHPKHELRWTYDMAVAALQLKSPDTVGWIPQVDGEFDLNYSALLLRPLGAGDVRFCTLDFLGRKPTTGEDDRPGVTDAAVDSVAIAVMADFLKGSATVCDRAVVADGAQAAKIADEVGVARQEKVSGAKSLLLVGKDSKLSPTAVAAAAERGANVLVVANDALARAFGFTLVPSPKDTYNVRYNRENPVLRGLSQTHFRWRERMKYSVLKKTNRSGWTVDPDGMIAVKTLKNGAQIVLCQMDPFYLEEKVTTDTHYDVDGQDPPMKIDEANRKRNFNRAGMSFIHCRQVMSRILTNLGAAVTPSESAKVYLDVTPDFDPYLFVFW